MPRIVDMRAPTDGRQSETAVWVARGVRRLLSAQGFSTITELPLSNGKRADIVAVTREGIVIIVEIKSSITDFRADTKWLTYREHCDRFYFAAPEIVPTSIFPENAGLIIADAYGATVMREAELHKISGATRRAVLLAFARTAADRLHLLADPERDSNLL